MIGTLIKALMGGGGDKKPEPTAHGFQGMNPEDEERGFGQDMMSAPPKMTLGNPQLRKKPGFEFNGM